MIKKGLVKVSDDDEQKVVGGWPSMAAKNMVHEN